MKARPILMHGRSVQNLLAGRKTQTRRIVNPQPCGGHPCDFIEVVWGEAAAKLSCSQPADRAWAGFRDHRLQEHESAGYYGCPKGQPGDLLYVRETWAFMREERLGQRRELKALMGPIPEVVGGDFDVWYKADGKGPPSGCWRPSIHMPRWASRLTLHLTDVRVERVQEISTEDCKAEGVEPDGNKHGYLGAGYKPAFRKLWNDTNGPSAWDRNDWVWVLEFDVIQANVDDVIADPARYGIRGAAA